MKDRKVEQKESGGCYVLRFLFAPANLQKIIAVKVLNVVERIPAPMMAAGLTLPY